MPRSLQRRLLATADKLQRSTLGILQHCGEHANTILQLIQYLLDQQREKEEEHNAKRRQKLITDAVSNNDMELASRLQNEEQTSVDEVRRMIRETHNDYFETMSALKRRQETNGAMIGLTPAEAKRLEKFEVWRAREMALRPGQAQGDCATHDVNTRNVPYLLLPFLVVAAVREELEKNSADVSASQAVARLAS